MSQTLPIQEVNRKIQEIKSYCLKYINIDHNQEKAQLQEIFEMTTQFRKSKSFGPVRFTAGKRGVSSSIGIKGFRLTFGKRGTTITTGIPGTGIYNRQTINNASGNTSSFDSEYGWNKKGLSKAAKLLFFIFVGIPLILFFIFLFLGGVMLVSEKSMVGAGCLLFGLPLLIWFSISFYLHNKCKKQ